LKKYKDSSSSNVVFDPAVSYSALSPKYRQLSVILGGSQSLSESLTSEMDLVTLSRSGLPRRTLDAIASRLNITMEKLSDLLHISHRTIQRKSPSDHLSVHVSEQILAIAEVIRRAQEVIGTDSDIVTWLNSPLAALDDQRPLDLMDTSIGTQLLLRILGRIEYGVY
jgi:putative toxin-antitoxin system antitoxin component (TIGR02293 family)